MIASAEAELGRRVTDLLTRERLLDGDAKVTTYSTPRRLAVLGRRRSRCAGRHRRAVDGPLVGGGVQRRRTHQGRRSLREKGRRRRERARQGHDTQRRIRWRNGEAHWVAAAQVLTAELPKEVLSIYWAKNMYWRAGKPERFVRPVRWVVALLDSQIVPLEIAGIAAGNASRGHRVLHGDSPVVIGSAEGIRREPARRQSNRRCCGAPADHPQGAGQGDAHGSRSTLARR